MSNSKVAKIPAGLEIPVNGIDSTETTSSKPPIADTAGVATEAVAADGPSLLSTMCGEVPYNPEDAVPAAAAPGTFGKKRGRPDIVVMQRPEKDQWVYIPEKVQESPKAYMLFRESRRKKSRGFWVPTRAVMEQLGEKRVRPYFLLPYATDEQTFGLWPVPDAAHDYAVSAYNIWRDFNGQWVRIETDETRGCYFAEPSSIFPPHPAPVWPAGGFQWMQDECFAKRMVRSMAHFAVAHVNGPGGGDDATEF